MSGYIWQRKNQGNCVTLYWHCFPKTAKAGDHPICAHQGIKFRVEHYESSDSPPSKCKKCESQLKAITNLENRNGK